MSKRSDASAKRADEGCLALPDTWTPDIGEARAHARGLILGPRHWQVICAAREEVASGQRAPSMKRIALRAGLALDDLLSLFPSSPAVLIACIAGIAPTAHAAPPRRAGGS
jgi:sulfur relay (sulfurtransferase) DsrC/TusE family protein